MNFDRNKPVYRGYIDDMEKTGEEKVSVKFALASCVRPNGGQADEYNKQVDFSINDIEAVGAGFSRGSLLEFQTDGKDVVYARLISSSDYKPSAA